VKTNKEVKVPNPRKKHLKCCGNCSHFDWDNVGVSIDTTKRLHSSFEGEHTGIAVRCPINKDAMPNCCCEKWEWDWNDKFERLI